MKFSKSIGLFCCLGMMVLGTTLGDQVQAADGEQHNEKEAFFQEQELFNINDGEGYAEYRIPSVSITDEGTVLAVAEARTGGDQTPTDLVLRRSTDGGETFSEQDILTPGVSEGDAEMNPMLITENDGDTVYLLWSRWEWDNPKYFMKKSTDDGATWEEAEDITYVLDDYQDPDNPEYFADLSGAGMGPGHGFQMSNGALVVPIYLTTANWEESTVAYIYSTDDGSTWQSGPLVPYPDGFTKIHENMMVETSDGGLMTNMRNPDSNYRAVATTDGLGQKWSSPVSDEALIDPVNQGSLANDEEGNIFFTNTANAAARTNMTIRMSGDDGKTWDASREIYAGNTGYSDVNIGPGQTIYTLYEKPAGNRIVLAQFNKEWINEGEQGTTVHNLQSMVEAFVNEGQLTEQSEQPVMTHLKSIAHYEAEERFDKMIKHLNGFEHLLDYQLDAEQISPQAHQALLSKTNELLEDYE